MTRAPDGEHGAAGPGRGTGRPWARFDDLRTGVAVRCPPPHRVVVAERPEEVVGALREVDEATRRGDWAFGYVAYEAASGLDATLPGGPLGGGLPLVWFGLCGEPARVAPVRATTEGDAHHRRLSTWQPDWTDADHARAVARVRERIAAGETYQCNLTDRFRARVLGDREDAPEELYAALASAQRGAHHAFVDLGRYAVASASPELFFEWADDRVRTRPMKGTAARGRTTAEDARQASALRTSAKEQAENLMVVDLLRNDLTRVARTGSVVVDELFGLERYPTVWQMTSQVSADVRAGVDLVEMFRALFPCGSVTGAPKRRTMELVVDLEPSPRGVYCGAVGLVAPPSAPFRARFGVAIRTAVVDRGTGAAVYGAGGGITWGSDPLRERAEVRAKAAVLTHAAHDHQLVETMAYVPGRGLRSLGRHLARLADSAAYFGFGCEHRAVVAALEASVAGLDRPARVRLLLDREGRTRVQVQDMPAAVPGPVQLALDEEPVDSASPWLQHKTTRRDVYVARALRHPGADDVVLVNERGEVTETTVATLAVQLDGSWWTPATGSGCLPGVGRGRLLHLGVLRERDLTVADARHAERLAVVSSLRGWRPAVLAGTATSPGRGRRRAPRTAGDPVSPAGG